MGSMAWGQGFSQAKVQVTSATSNLMLMVDDECMNRMGVYRAMSNSGYTVRQKRMGNLKQKALVLQGSSFTTKAMLAEVAKSECIVGITDNPQIKITATGPDPLVSEQPALKAIEYEAGEKIFFHPVFGIAQSVTFAVVDTGLEADHPDIEPRLWQSAAGRMGYDFVNDDEDPTDDNGHGTHVAGIIAAQRNNAEGIKGVMGDFSKIMALKTQDAQGNGSLSDVVNAINWAAENGADVINLSLASRNRNVAVETAIKAAIAKNIVVVTAAGNDNQLLAANNFITPISYSAEIRGLIGVGSIDAITLAKSSFSNFSPSLVEIVAPGSSGTAGILSCHRNKNYRGLDGTSGSAPQVAGAAGLIISFLKTHKFPYTPDSVEKFLEMSAVEDANNTANALSGRRLSVQRLGKVLLNHTVLSSSGGFDE